MHEGKYTASAKELALLALDQDMHPESGENWVTHFELEFAKLVGSQYAVAVNSGTSGLHAALLALGVGVGDEVISPALTVVMDAFATLYTGATPIFADVDPNTWNIDPISVEKLINEKTKAIISVSWFGLPSNLKTLSEISRKYGIPIIDDSAETISESGYQPYDVKAPEFRVFSFESKKHFSTGGEGGMLVTNDPVLAERARKGAGLGYKHLSAGKGRTSLASRVFQNPAYERFDSLGFNYRMTPVTAAIGIGQLNNLSNFLSFRRKAGAAFISATKDCPWLIPQNSEQDGIPHTYYTFGLRFEQNRAPGLNWTDFYDLFKARGGDGFYSNCKNPYLEPFFRGKKFSNQNLETGLAPIAEKLQSEIMAFKTNYLSEHVIVEQARILSNLIDEIGRN